MKKTVMLTLISLLILSCGGGGGTDSETGFSIQPGELTKFTINTNQSYTITFNGAPVNPVTPGQYYAVLFNSQVGAENYVGIAISTDPSNASAFNLKLILTGTTTIPTGNGIAFNNPPWTIKVKSGDSTYSWPTNLTTIDINGPDANNIFTIGNLSVTLQRDSGTGPLAPSLTITSINAVKVN